jgi:multidrug efflux pump subunit AcrA (membrane-fusion protein)
MPDNSSAYVEDIASLEEMRAALLRFQSEANDALRNAQREITAAHDQLQDRLHYWQRQLSKRQEALGQARDALARCLSLRGPHGERADCSAPAAAVRQAEQRVQEAQEAIRTAQIHIKRVEEANASFLRQAHRFSATLTSHELPRASALLSKCASILQSYIAQQAPVVGRFATRAGRIASALGAALIIIGAVPKYPFDVSTELPVPEELPVAITSTEKQMEGAKLTLEIADDFYEAEKKKREIQDETVPHQWTPQTHER